MKPNPDSVFPKAGVESMTNVKAVVRNPRILAGDFTYYAGGADFESRVTHHYEFIGDRLILGKFCQIAAGVEFVMNGANHPMKGASTFPFHVLDGWGAPQGGELTIKGDTVIGNDVWIGQDATILPGVKIGDGAIVGARSVVGRDVEAYTVVCGNPARPVRRRFDEELTGLLLELKWWDRPVEEIQRMIPLLTGSNPEELKRGIRKVLGG